ncbi:hypothetical protein D3C85_1511990 [compost metagenome]
MQAQGFAGTRLVDEQRRQAALGEKPAHYAFLQHLLGAVEAVHDHHDRRPCPWSKAAGAHV